MLESVDTSEELNLLIERWRSIVKSAICRLSAGRLKKQKKFVARKH